MVNPEPEEVGCNPASHGSDIAAPCSVVGVGVEVPLLQPASVNSPAKSTIIAQNPGILSLFIYKSPFPGLLFRKETFFPP
jgi:hypothetical protein